MSKKTRDDLDDLRGVSRLAVDATERVTEVVESMHTTIASGPEILGKPLELPVRLLNGLVYGSVRGATRLVGKSIERALDALAPLLGQSVPGPEREAWIAVLNGVLGDHLEGTQNPLAIRMSFRHAGHPIALETEALRALFPEARRLLVLIHGSCANDLAWNRNGHDHGAALASERGYAAIYLHCPITGPKPSVNQRPGRALPPGHVSGSKSPAAARVAARVGWY